MNNSSQHFPEFRMSIEVVDKDLLQEEQDNHGGWESEKSLHEWNKKVVMRYMDRARTEKNKIL